MSHGNYYTLDSLNQKLIYPFLAKNHYLMQKIICCQNSIEFVGYIGFIECCKVIPSYTKQSKEVPYYRKKTQI